jgi:sugar lactone lactonase YvrE
MKTIIILLTVAFYINVNAQVVTTLAGTTTPGSVDGTGTAARFNFPGAVAYDGNGNLFVADAGNNEIRKIAISTGVVTTLAGSTTSGSADGTGSAASFFGPTGVACDGSGNLYVVDAKNNEIRKVVIATGVVTTLAGSTTAGSADGTGAAASFHIPTGIACDGSGNLYVADFLNNEIRKIVISTGVVTTLAGTTTSGSADGTGSAASFNKPNGVACDVNGNLYVADTYNNEIRKIVTSTGVVTTLAGSTTAGSVDGTGVAARFNAPGSVACDSIGNLYVADENNNEIRKMIISTTVVTTLAGSTTAGSADGTGTAARFNLPSGVACGANGSLYVADRKNHEIRKMDNTTGINEMYNSIRFTVYPNPSNGIVFLSSERIISSFEIINSLGKEVYSSRVDSNKSEIDLNDQPKGIYFLRIKVGNDVATKKIIICK